MIELRHHYTVMEFAKKKGVSHVTVYRAIEDKRITPTYVGRSRMIFLHPENLKVEFRASNKQQNASGQDET